MTKIKNTSPIGDLDVPLLGCTVKAGEIIEVSPERAERLLKQADVWQLADSDPSQRPAESATKSQWVAHADHLGIDGTAKMTKPELIEATTHQEPNTGESGDTNDTNDAALAAEKQGE